jgi:hypothetical protein
MIERERRRRNNALRIRVETIAACDPAEEEVVIHGFISFGLSFPWTERSSGWRTLNENLRIASC